METNDEKIKHHAKRIRRGRYEYRGFIVYSIGYYPPENRIVWEVVDHDGSCFAHAFSLQESKHRIDEELIQENREAYGNQE